MTPRGARLRSCPRSENPRRRSATVGRDRRGVGLVATPVHSAQIGAHWSKLAPCARIGGRDTAASGLSQLNDSEIRRPTGCGWVLSWTSAQATLIAPELPATQSRRKNVDFGVARFTVPVFANSRPIDSRPSSYYLSLSKPRDAPSPTAPPGCGRSHRARRTRW